MASPETTVAPPNPEGLASVLARNIRALEDRRRREEAALAERRAELDLQITLLAEHEITRALKLIAAVAEKLGVEGAADEEIVELKRDVAPEAVLDRLEDEAERHESSG